MSDRLSVPSDNSKPAAAGMLLWAWHAGDIDQLLQQRRAVGECVVSATLSVYVES